MDGGNKHLKLYNELCIEQLWQNICELSVERCYECEVDHPSQTEHSCLMDSNYTKVIFYFELAFIKLDPEKIYSELLNKNMCEQEDLSTFWNDMKVYVCTDAWKQDLFRNLENQVQDY